MVIENVELNDLCARENFSHYQIEGYLKANNITESEYLTLTLSQQKILDGDHIFALIEGYQLSFEQALNLTEQQAKRLEACRSLHCYIEAGIISIAEALWLTETEIEVLRPWILGPQPIKDYIFQGKMSVKEVLRLTVEEIELLNSNELFKACIELEKLEIKEVLKLTAEELDILKNKELWGYIALGKLGLKEVLQLTDEEKKILSSYWIMGYITIEKLEIKKALQLTAKEIDILGTEAIADYIGEGKIELKAALQLTEAEIEILRLGSISKDVFQEIVQLTDEEAEKVELQKYALLEGRGTEETPQLRAEEMEALERITNEYHYIKSYISLRKISLKKALQLTAEEVKVLEQEYVWNCVLQGEMEVSEILQLTAKQINFLTHNFEFYISRGKISIKEALLLTHKEIDILELKSIKQYVYRGRLEVKEALLLIAREIEILELKPIQCYIFQGKLEVKEALQLKAEQVERFKIKSLAARVFRGKINIKEALQLPTDQVEILKKGGVYYALQQGLISFEDIYQAQEININKDHVLLAQDKTVKVADCEVLLSHLLNSSLEDVNLILNPFIINTLVKPGHVEVEKLLKLTDEQARTLLERESQPLCYCIAKKLISLEELGNNIKRNQDEHTYGKTKFLLEQDRKVEIEGQEVSLALLLNAPNDQFIERLNWYLKQPTVLNLLRQGTSTIEEILYATGGGRFHITNSDFITKCITEGIAGQKLTLGQVLNMSDRQYNNFLYFNNNLNNNLNNDLGRSLWRHRDFNDKDDGLRKCIEEGIFSLEDFSQLPAPISEEVKYSLQTREAREAIRRALAPYTRPSLFIALLGMGSLRRNAFNEQQNTHTASVHQSVAKSIENLARKYGSQIKALERDKALQEILNYIEAAVSASEDLRYIHELQAAKRFIVGLITGGHSSQAIGTDLTISELIALAWVAIHDDCQREGNLAEAKKELINRVL